MVRLLLVHQGFPGQFKHLIPALIERGDEVWAISTPRDKGQIPSGVQYLKYKLKQGNGKDTFALATEFETKVIRGEAVARVALRLAKGEITGKPWAPDIIVGHPGWGEMLFLADVWAHVPQLHYVEFFHGVPGTDNDIADQYAKPQNWTNKARARVKNTNLLSNLNQMHAGLCPTHFQKSLLPDWAQERTKVIHDGINIEWLCPDETTELVIPPNSETKNRQVLRTGDPVITFINRTFEPYRGIHIFLEALAQLQSVHPTAQTVLIGSDTPKVSYGARREDGRGWLTALREEMGNRLDWERIHHLGQVPHTTLRDVYRVSQAHVYLTYPFVLSWSLLEAMSCGALIIGSDTAPLKEVIENKKNGLLVPFGDTHALARNMLEALRQPENFINMRNRARQDIERNYKIQNCLRRQLQLIDSIAAKNKNKGYEA